MYEDCTSLLDIYLFLSRQVDEGGGKAGGPVHDTDPRDHQPLRQAHRRVH